MICFKDYVFLKSLRNDIKVAQEKVLLKILKNNQETFYGQKYRFNQIHDIGDFRNRAPITNYDDYEPYITKIQKGHLNILTKDPVLLLEPSSGSTSPSKYIPYTKSLQKEFLRGIRPWIFDLFNKRKKLLLGSAYWSISPKKEVVMNDGVVPIGFNSDSEYFGLIERRILKRLMVTPPEVSEIQDIEAFRYVTLLFLLKNKFLSFISVWNPTFLTLILEKLIPLSNSLIDDIRYGRISTKLDIESSIREKISKKLTKDERRASEIDCIIKNSKDEDKLIYQDIWPNLRLISCWADGPAEILIKEIRKYFLDVEIQPKGLLATEGVISLPLAGEGGCAIAVNSHFFEFIEQDLDSESSENTKLLYEIEMGKRYSVLITTGGGLYRYRLHDIIEVVGFKGQCPLIKFVGKEDKVVDLYGEKLNEYHVKSVLREVFLKNSLDPEFVLIAPEQIDKNGRGYYTLFLKIKNCSQQLKEIEREIDELFQENYHYKYCRKLGQLLPLRIFLIDTVNNAKETYMKICNKRGQRLGDIKPSVLVSYKGLTEEFTGSFLS